MSAVEHLLHVLTSCMATSLVVHAAVRGIVVDDIDTSTEGDIDVRKGYQVIRILMKVKSKASSEQLKELALFSPVYDVVSNALSVAFNIETYS